MGRNILEEGVGMKAKVIYDILFLTGEDISILCRLRGRDG